MSTYLVQDAASHRLDEIYCFTREHWGQEQADHYITGLFDTFGKIATHQILSRPIPAEFGVDGYVCRYQRHLVYWKHLAGGKVGIVTVLHERMHQIDRFRVDFGL